jgi:hypothetical protein
VPGNVRASTQSVHSSIATPPPPRPLLNAPGGGGCSPDRALGTAHCTGRLPPLATPECGGGRGGAMLLLRSCITHSKLSGTSLLQDVEAVLFERSGTKKYAGQLTVLHTNPDSVSGESAKECAWTDPVHISTAPPPPDIPDRMVISAACQTVRCPQQVVHHMLCAAG